MPGPALSPDQDAAADACVQRWTGGFSVTLLDGVTGSGKTEVYFEAIAEALPQAGRQALVLLPEIALTRAVAGALRGALRRGAGAVAFRASRSRARAEPGARWRAARRAVVVGARSALFLPFRDLGLIVVDEEHDAAFKQEDGVVYHARDMAVVRAQLGADRRSCSSRRRRRWRRVHNVERGRYAALHLPERHGGAPLPEVATDRPARASRRRASAGSRRRCVEAVDGDAGGAASRRCCSSTAAAMRR